MDGTAFQGDIIQITDKEDISYLASVLRMKEGDALLVSDGVGRACEARITEMGRPGGAGKPGIALEVIGERTVEDAYKTRITLYQGLAKGEKMSEVARKATELGVHRIVPTLTARSVPDVGSAAKLERWRRIAEEASRQAQRWSVPEVADVVNLEDAAAGLAAEAYDLALVLYELEEAQTLKQVIAGGRFQKVAVFVGPEGGFEKNEVDTLIMQGAYSVTIGETILRTETAGPAAIAMLLYELEL